jgi:hypothetical protein
VPYGLKFLYDFDIPKNILTDTNWIFLIGHLAIITLALKKLSKPILKILFIGFYLSFIPESSFFPINHLAFEHRTYFPMIFLFLFLGSSLAQIDIDKEFRKLILIFTAGVCLTYIVLNQNRNIDIKRYGSWALHTLNNSIMYDYSNFFFSFLLARAGNFDEIEPLVKKYPEIKKGQNYEILVDIFNYYKFPEKKEEYFLKFLGYLQQDDIPDHARLFLNKIILEEFANKNDSPEKLFVIEINLAKQIDFIWERREKFPQLISNFQTLGNFILAPPFDKDFRKFDYHEFLHIKVYLTKYFDLNFDNLKSDLNMELQKYPNDEKLKSLANKLDSR